MQSSPCADCAGAGMAPVGAVPVGAAAGTAAAPGPAACMGASTFRGFAELRRPGCCTTVHFGDCASTEPAPPLMLLTKSGDAGTGAVTALGEPPGVVPA